METLIPTPEEKQVAGIVIGYMIFNFFGGLIFLFKNYEAKKMGLLSLTLGFILEFAFMKPDWVQNIYTFNIAEPVIAALIISAFYWFTMWGGPSYIIRKYLIKNPNAIK
jgi:hypothetical protein